MSYAPFPLIWGGQSGSGGGISTIGTIDSISPSLNGLTISGSSLIAQSTSLTMPGMINLSTQTLGDGWKTFSNRLSLTHTPFTSANYGRLSIGSAPFDGSTTGFFSGSSFGTSIAVNEPSGYTGDLISIQVGGDEIFNVSSQYGTYAEISMGSPFFSTGPGGYLEMFDTIGPGIVKLSAPPVVGSNWTLYFPVNAGSNGQALTTDGSGNTSWTTLPNGVTLQTNGSTNSTQTLLNLISGSGFLTIGESAGTVTFTATGAATLGTNQIGFGDGSNLLTGNSNFIYNSGVLSNTSTSQQLRLAYSNTVGLDFTMNINGNIAWDINGGTNAKNLFNSPIVSSLYYGSVNSSGNLLLSSTTDSTKGYIGITDAVTATADFGTLSLGSAPFDGSTSGKFTGSASGTLIAGNLSSGSTSDFLNFQVAGVNKLNINSSGNLTSYGSGTVPYCINAVNSTSGTGMYLTPQSNGFQAIRSDEQLSLISGQSMLIDVYGGKILYLGQNNPGTSIIIRPTGYLAVSSNSRVGSSFFSVPVAPTASANYGTNCFGSSPFDGSTSGFFAGSANGTTIAINESSSFTGNFLDIQADGVSKAKIDKDGTGTFAGNIIISGSTSVVRLKGYTVATLPSGTQGDTAYVTDATAPTYLGSLTGSGSVVCRVFYNGSVWVSC